MFDVSLNAQELQVMVGNQSMKIYAMSLQLKERDDRIAQLNAQILHQAQRIAKLDTSMWEKRGEPLVANADFPEVKVVLNGDVDHSHE